MKTLKITVLLAVTALFLFACNSPLSLGTKLDIEGPLVEFLTPAPRKAVGEQFTIEGKVSDKSTLDKLHIKTSINSVEFAKQWRWIRGTGWQVSEDFGLSWTDYPQAEWNGNENSASWVLPVDLSINGVLPSDGEYMFSAQAWDIGGMSDDNSLKTLVLIYDIDPPIVSVYNPYLYDRFQYDGSDFYGELKTLVDATTWKDPALLGKFLTQEFQLQWQIEDQHDIWSIELLFYEHDADIDGLVDTEVPQDYIYYYHENLPPPELDPLKNIKPNGSVMVPNLAGTEKKYSEDGFGGELKNQIKTKTTVKVVSRCFDAAGWVSQEKVLGYFIFWPEAVSPWITFTDGMKDVKDYEDKTYVGDTGKDAFEGESFMIYPGRSIKATAFQAQGVSRVEFTLHNYDYTKSVDDRIGEALDFNYLERPGETVKYAPGYGIKRLVVDNAARPNGSFSTIFPWDFRPPPRSGGYVIKATAYDFMGRASTEYQSVFRVQDISFPDFPTSPTPAASLPLFKAINPTSGNIIISGYVSDATEITSLYMVWINPESRNWAAMSQLSYFRDSGYTGWIKAIESNLPNSGFVTEGEYDSANPNKVWKVAVTSIGEDDGKFNEGNSSSAINIFGADHEPTYRQVYSYSLTINLSSHLNISSGGGQPLISQMFLLRAENPDKKTTIITYAPQGDTVYPTIKINEVRVSRTGADDIVCLPGEFEEVRQFLAGDRIRVYGEWTEDSTEILRIQDYLTPSMEFEINRVKVTGTLTPASGNATSGTFLIDVNVGQGNLGLSNMRDTLTVNASMRDIGGNPAEVGNSWLIASDTLRFLRITSFEEDKAYKTGDTVDIFIEFNKPVKLKDGRSNDPVLILNTTGGATATAVYKGGQNTASERQYFTYTVGAGQNTPAGQYLNVSGISINGGTSALPVNDTAWIQAAYPFTWEHTTVSGAKEEVRLTRTAAHNGAVPAGYTFYARAVPVTTNSGDTDYMFTLGGGKRIQVDNLAPVISSFSVSPAGWHKSGAEIYITANFNKPIKIDGVPYLVLGTGQTGTNAQTSSNAGDIRVNNSLTASPPTGAITFKYTVKADDTTGTSELLVTGFDGTIQDIPGTTMAANAVSGMSAANRTLTGVYLDNTPPSEPVITVYDRVTPTTAGATAIGNTTGGNAVLGNLYHDNMSIRINGTTGGQHFKTLEYTLNGDAGTPTWTVASAATNNDITLVNNGNYNIRTRQTDNAGNVSNVTKSVTLNLDKGALVTSINSFTANGTYTNNAARTDTISIQVNFRKALTFSGSQSITLNVTGGTAGSNVITLNPPPTAATNQLTFTYNVASGHTTGTNTRLAVTALNLNATDGGTANTVPLTVLNELPATANRLQTLKEIYIQTGALTVTTNAAFNNGSLSGATAGVQTDGSYNTALTVTFNRPIFKNAGNVTITQVAANFRVPAVLTEAQYNKYRDVPNFNTYYTRGTNGYIGNDTIANGTPDTSVKYVLAYNFNTSVTPNGGGTGEAKFADDFRLAERIQLPVNSSAVRINGSQLIVDLAGANALQVPGASYLVEIDANFVQDALSNRSAAITAPSLEIAGVARPFIRVLKKQDTITVNTVGDSQTTPRLAAGQPLFTTARMDTRTPGATIHYIATTLAGSVTTAPGFPGNWGTGGPSDNNTNPARPAVPRITANNRQAYNGEVTIGDNTTTLANVQGLRWHVRAQATSLTGTNPAATPEASWSTESEEMAYRTVLTYAVTSDMTNAAPGQNFTSGDGGTTSGKQIWVRGGNAIEVSTIPGFPLTWQDDWDTLKAEGKRAGIRLLSLVSSGTNLNTSTWRWVTWEVNVDTYFDIILGYDPDGSDGTNFNTVNVVRQYGPRQWALQRAGWTSFKEQYRIYAGKHRYMVVTTAGNFETKGPVNFSGTWSARPNMPVLGDVTWTAP
jgi:hypothetical protein